MFLKAAAAISTIAALTVLILIIGFTPREVAPVQPIEFSHKVHVEEFKIGCLYCHINVRRSIVAGIPSMQLCMGCHKNVGKDKAGIQMLSQYWQQRRSIEWLKVNDLPDFVYFSHKRHVAADVACTTCHGEVQAMNRVSRGPVHTMESCVNCHLERHASVDCWTCHK